MLPNPTPAWEPSAPYFSPVPLALLFPQSSPLTLARRLAPLLEQLPVGISLSHWKLACPLKGCVLISWALCCLLVAILLLTSLTRTTWAVGCWLRRMWGSWLHTLSAGSPVSPRG